jgi:eukaryotic-like serine/threonine-protein kinase
MTLRPGLLLSHYRVAEKIGEGGMGVVYRARDERLERDVALKVLPAGVLGDETARKRFHKEALALSRLNHPNIGTIYDFDTQEGVDFLVMEYIPGQTVAQRLASGGLPEKEVASLGVQIASALEEAHGQGVVHRDLKPGNVMVSPKSQVKVLDFGLARLMPRVKDASRAETMSQTHAVVGTLPYMAPEQLRGENVDARTDLFALGAVLYEMATGKRPFREETSPLLTDAILHQKPAPPHALNASVSQEMDRIILKCLAKDPADRYQHAEEVGVDLKRLERSADPGAAVRRREPGLWLLVPAAAVLLALLAVAGHFHFRPAQALTESDSVLLADFVNTTGDPVFDPTLREALAVKLEESPFLNVVPDQRVQETLRFMGRPPGERVTGQVAREICQREGIKAVLEGAIASLGRRYVITLKAENCATGSSLARQQVEASSKEEVLASLGQAAARLRERLGESLGSIQAYDTPIAEATTSSFEALKAYSLGATRRGASDELGAVPFFKRALDLDPDFALAHVALSMVYLNLGESGLAQEQARKAFELRDRVSERERLGIEARYYGTTGEIDKALETYELYSHTYPRSAGAHGNLAECYKTFGQWDKALEENEKAVQLAPNFGMQFINMAETLIALDRLEQAKAALRAIVERRGESVGPHPCLYEIAFLEADAAAMEKHAAATRGTPDESDNLLQQADVARSSGRMRTARALCQRAVDLLQEQRLNEAAALAVAREALFEGEFGDRPLAGSRAGVALSISNGKAAQTFSAIAFARAGQGARAHAVADELARQSPVDTRVQQLWLPIIGAGLAIEGGDSGKAIQLLRAASRFDLAWAGDLLPSYFRGLAYLQARAGPEAGAEFQRILDHKGIAPLSPTHALARLGLARAHALAGDTARSRAAYEDFLALWKDADTDVPILQAARAEYARLK